MPPAARHPGSRTTPAASHRPGDFRGTASSKLRDLELAGAERRVRYDLAETGEPDRRARRGAVVGIALLLFSITFSLRVAIDDPNALLANFYTVPIALVAAELGFRAGLAVAAFALGLVFLWRVVAVVHVSALGYVSRAAVFAMVGGLVGVYAERHARDVASRRRDTRELELKAGELGRSNEQLRQAVLRLEAFAEIARSVGGETELRRMLDLILDRAREIMDARAVIACLGERGELFAAGVSDHAAVRIGGLAATPLGEVLSDGRARRSLAPDGELVSVAPGLEARAAIAVPLHFQGRRLGAIAALDRITGGPQFDESDEDLMHALAASAATAVATAQSVAHERLRQSIEAAEESRGRWARELHDETLQGLVGLRLILSSARRAGSGGRVDELLEEAVEQARREIVNLRALIAELRPAALDELGLGPAIETLAERSAAVGGLDVTARVALGSGDRRLAPETEGAIYRVVQEALTNVAKHAHAEHVRVLVEADNGSIEVSVEDDGRGFDPAAATDGFGLVGMRERVELTGGRLEIDSAPGATTRVRARLPAA